MRGLLIVPVMLAAAGVYVSVDQTSGIARWLEQRDGLERAHARIEGLEAKVAALRDEVALLHEDPFELERAIREELELAREGETVVRLGGVTPLGSPAVAAPPPGASRTNR